MKKDIVKNALINAGVTAAYIITLVFLLSHAESVFGKEDPENKFFIPVIMLLALVISATVTGAAVLGRPVTWYLDGKKKEAFRLLAATIGVLMVIAVIFVTIAIPR
jgi:amino acid transporter